MDDFSYVLGPDAGAENAVLVGRGSNILRIRSDHWKGHVAVATERVLARLAFMSEEHHLVRHFAVKEIARRSSVVTEAQISRQLKLPRSRVHQILDELESHLFFVVRNARGAVSWAYPFTSDETPHRVVRQLRRPARAA